MLLFNIAEYYFFAEKISLNDKNLSLCTCPRYGCDIFVDKIWQVIIGYFFSFFPH